MAILNVYINFICQHFLRNKLLASKSLSKDKSTCQHPPPTALRMEALGFTFSHTSGYIYMVHSVTAFKLSRLNSHPGGLLGFIVR